MSDTPIDGSGAVLPEGNIRFAARELAAAVAAAAKNWPNEAVAQRKTLVAMLAQIDFSAEFLGLDAGQRKPLIALGQALKDLDNGITPDFLKATSRAGRPPSKTWQARAYVCAAADALTRENPHYREAGLPQPEEVLNHKEASKQVAAMYFESKSEHPAEAKQIAEWRNEFQRMRVGDEDAMAIWNNCRECVSSGVVASYLAKAWITRSRQIEQLW